MNIIVAIDKNNGIGFENAIPWNEPLDRKHFQSITTNNIVIMGRKTMESIPVKNWPLKNRISIVLTSNPGEYAKQPNVFYVPNWQSVLEFTSQKQYKSKKKYIIGGSSIYDQVLKLGIVSTMIVTEIHDKYVCDKYFKVPRGWELMNSVVSENFTIHKYALPNVEELKVLDQMAMIVDEGNSRQDRTGVGNISLMCDTTFSFNLRGNKFPLMTTRPLPFRQILMELMWFLSGNTDVQWLMNQKPPIKIWNGNSDRKFLDSLGGVFTEYLDGDIGPSYGFQMRHSGGEYRGCHGCHTGEGVDQLSNTLQLLRSNPESRRIIINLWTVNQVEKMALPPCLFMYQFYVHEEKTDGKNMVRYLTCKAMQRSSDIALAGGWNIATASLLTIILANATGMVPHKLIWAPNDTHVYNNQIGGITEQIVRAPTAFPLLYLNKSLATASADNLSELTIDDFSLLNYTPQKKIKFIMN
jgi:thymidylate synthase